MGLGKDCVYSAVAGGYAVLMLLDFLYVLFPVKRAVRLMCCTIVAPTSFGER